MHSLTRASTPVSAAGRFSRIRCHPARACGWRDQVGHARAIPLSVAPADGMSVMVSPPSLSRWPSAAFASACCPGGSQSRARRPRTGPTLPLDIRARAPVLNLPLDRQRWRGLAYPFITNDFDVVHRTSDKAGMPLCGPADERGSEEGARVLPAILPPTPYFLTHE